MKTLFLHAGKHKTGTTSFQDYVLRHRDWLAGQGLHVFMAPSHRIIHEGKPIIKAIRLANAVIRPELKIGPRLRGKLETFENFAARKKACEEFNAQLHAVDASKILVTSEDFSLLRHDGERKLLDIMFEGFRLRPVLIFRETSDWMRSWSKQVIKLSRQFPEEAAKGRGLFRTDVNSWLIRDEEIRNFFGPGGAYLSYEDLMRGDGSVIPGLLAAMGIDPDMAPDHENIWLNATGDKP